MGVGVKIEGVIRTWTIIEAEIITRIRSILRVWEIDTGKLIFLIGDFKDILANSLSARFLKDF